MTPDRYLITGTRFEALYRGEHNTGLERQHPVHIECANLEATLETIRTLAEDRVQLIVSTR